MGRQNIAAPTIAESIEKASVSSPHHSLFTDNQLRITNYQQERGLYQTNWHRPRIDANLPWLGAAATAISTPLDMKNTMLSNGVNRVILIATLIPVYGAGRYRRISSKYAVPEPPACGFFLSPKPIAIVLTLARFTPWSANPCRSIFHSVQVSINAAFGLS